MGVIQRQSIKGLLVFIGGAFIHFCTMLWLMPQFLPESDFAVYRVYFSLITVFGSLGAGGIGAIVMQHYQELQQNKEKLKTFNTFTLSYALLCSIITIVLIYVSKDILYAVKKTETPFLMSYFFVVPLSTLSYVLLTYFEAYSIATHRLTAPTIVKEIVLRVVLLLGVVLYYFHYISIYQFFLFYAFSYFLGFLILMIYSVFFRGYKLGFDILEWKQLNMKKYIIDAFYILMIGFVGALILNIDQPVVYAMLGSGATLIYGHAVTSAALITIPYKPLAAILVPFAFNAWKENDIKKLNEINRESSKYLSAIGALLFALLVANIDNILVLAPKFASFKWPLIIIGIGRVLDYATGISSEILLTSPSNRKLILYMILTFLFSLLCYKIFIPTMHEIGAAISCSLTLVFYNVLKYYHLKKRYNLQPITLKSVYFVLLGFSVLGLQYLLPSMNHFIIDIAFRSFLVFVLFASVVYIFKWLPEVNQFINSALGIKHKQ